MAGLVPAIHVFLLAPHQDVDARDKRGHDGHHCSWSFTFSRPALTHSSSTPGEPDTPTPPMT
jgi:hypothetical protein